jgi:tripartite-type tricarboxylate transporter receptor subunit TctC
MADSFPSKPVKILVTNPPGGSSDLMARILGQKLGDIWKQSVVIENRAGAAGLIGMTYVASQPPDGYTLLFGAQGSTIVTPLLSKVPYDMDKDFTPLSLVATGPSILMVNANSPYKTVQDLINAAKAKPSSINYGSGGVGTAAHLGAEMFNSYANIKTVHVPYKGGISAINDLAADQIQFQFTDAAPVIPFIKSGKLRPLAVTTPKRFSSMPDVPTFAESGLPMFIAVNSWGMFMPSGAQPALVAQLQADIRKALSSPDLIKRYAELGFDAQNTSPEEFKSFLASENARYAKLIRDAKIKGE